MSIDLETSKYSHYIKFLFELIFYIRYYEDLDQPFGQHRWVEYSNIHDVDATMIQPEWHGWMHHVFDETPEEARQLGFSAEAITDHSHVPFFSNTGATNPVDMKEQHNTSQYRYLYYNLFL